jgi:cell division protein FtsQ
MGVKAPEDKRFRRAASRPASRRRVPAWLPPALRVAAPVIVILAALGAGVQALVGSPRFTVKHVTVTGNHRLADGAVTALLDGLPGQHLLRLDLAEWRARLESSPWVAGADLRRVLPDTVEVVIAERVPLGLGRVHGRLYLLDEDGTVIDEFGPQHEDLDLPIVDGLAHVEAARRGPRAALAARLLHALARRPELLERVSQVDVSTPRDAVVLLDGDTARLHLGDRDFVARLQSYLELSPALRSRVPAMDYVDLRFDDRVFVRPVPGSEVPGAPDAAPAQAR